MVNSNVNHIRYMQLLYLLVYADTHVTVDYSKCWLSLRNILMADIFHAKYSVDYSLSYRYISPGLTCQTVTHM